METLSHVMQYHASTSGVVQDRPLLHPEVLERAARAFREMQDTMTEAYKSSYV